MKYQIIIHTKKHRLPFQMIQLNDIGDEKIRAFLTDKCNEEVPLSADDLIFIILSYKKRILDSYIKLFHSKRFKHDNQSYLVSKCSMWYHIFNEINIKEDNLIHIPNELFNFEEVIIYNLMTLYNYIDWEKDFLYLKKEK